MIIESFWPMTGFGGPIRSSFAFCNHLAPIVDRLNVVTTNVTLKDSVDFDGRWRVVNGYKVFYAPTIGRSQFSPILVPELAREIADADVVHLSGVYSWLLPYVARLCRRSGAVLVCAPRGSLSEAARAQKRLRKRIFERLFFPTSFSSLAAFHATSAEEAADLRQLQPGVPILLLPNGVDVPAEVSNGPSLDRYFVYLGRLHPFKRIEMIISAFAQGPAGTDNTVELWIAGSGEPAYERELRRFAAAASDRVRFIGHVEGDAKSDLLRNAIALVLASKSESFGMSVAEALAHSIPCVVTPNVPWPRLSERGCGIYLQRDDAPALAEAMTQLMNMSPQERGAMGWRGREWMLADYSWAAIAQNARAAFAELIEARRGWTH